VAAVPAASIVVLVATLEPLGELTPLIKIGEPSLVITLARMPWGGSAAKVEDLGAAKPS
jgi:hypothetical protein